MANNKYQVSFKSQNGLIALVQSDEIKDLYDIEKLIDYLNKLEAKYFKAPEVKIIKEADTSMPIPKCQFCNGQVWDNRTSKTGKQPSFKCKSCGSAAWVNKDGSLWWKASDKAPLTTEESNLPF